ncbi:MAG: DUF4957 domain-containing protein [Paludibacter sp.]|nr:DUF4957 domain-containing protein [Paludibacter sp.]
MNKIINKLTYILGLTAVIFTAGCEDIPLEVTSLNTDRLFSPIGIEAKVTNKTQVTLDWVLNANAESYTIEVFADDSLTFSGSPVMTIEGIENSQLPYTILTGLIGQTNYSVRVKAVGANITESKWMGIFFKTDAEQIMTAVVDSEIQAHQVILNWTPGETATNIVLTAGENVVSHEVTEDEITAGKAIVTGLLEDASYTAKLMKDSKIRGSANFVTLIDLTAAGTIVVNPGDDLGSIILGAAADSRIVIVTTSDNDEYFVGGATLELDKNISIRGYSKINKPILHVHFRPMVSNTSLTVRDVILNGSSNGTLRDHLLQFTVTDTQSGDYYFKDCVITNYNKSLVAGASGIVVSINSFSLINCKVSNILTNSADCIDVRSGCIVNATLENSTFTNCAPARDFFRLDDSSAAFPDKTSTITVNKCSFSGVSNDASRRLLYVRFVNNNISFNNNVVANSLGCYTNNAATIATFSGNNYFNADNFITYTGTLIGVVTDLGIYTKLDPGFADVANANLTISNTTLLEKAVGANISW